jgi:hypothetical protein
MYVATDPNVLGNHVNNFNFVHSLEGNAILSKCHVHGQGEGG